MPNKPIQLLWEHQGIRCILVDAPYGVQLFVTQHETVVRSVQLATADVAFALAAQWQSAVRFDAGPDAA